MPRCPNRACRHPLPSVARFCPRCGHRAPRVNGAFLVALLIGFVGLGCVMLLMVVRQQQMVPATKTVDTDERPANSTSVDRPPLQNLPRGHGSQH